jgi:hypothetical protein
MQPKLSKYYRLPDSAKRCFRFIRNLVNKIVPIDATNVFTLDYFVKHIQKYNPGLNVDALKKLLRLIVKGTYGINMVYSEDVLPVNFAEGLAVYFDSYANDQFTVTGQEDWDKYDVTDYFTEVSGSPDAWSFAAEGNRKDEKRLSIHPVEDFIGDFYKQENDQEFIKEQIEFTRGQDAEMDAFRANIPPA